MTPPKPEATGFNPRHFSKRVDLLNAPVPRPPQEYTFVRPGRDRSPRPPVSPALAACIGGRRGCVCVCVWVCAPGHGP